MALKDKADQPKSASQDGASVEQHSLRDQIALDKHLASTAASARGKWPIRHIVHVPPGTV